MDQLSAPSAGSSRSQQDIALDLLKFVAAHANFGRGSGSAPGFGQAAQPKADDAVNQIFELYARCRAAVEEPVK